MHGLFHRVFLLPLVTCKAQMSLTEHSEKGTTAENTGLSYLKCFLKKFMRVILGCAIFFLLGHSGGTLESFLWVVVWLTHG